MADLNENGRGGHGLPHAVSLCERRRQSADDLENGRAAGGILGLLSDRPSVCSASTR